MNDMMTFNNAFAALHPIADIDRDATAGISDFTRFMRSYACGCNP